MFIWHIRLLHPINAHTDQSESETILQSRYCSINEHVMLVCHQSFLYFKPKNTNEPHLTLWPPLGDTFGGRFSMSFMRRNSRSTCAPPSPACTWNKQRAQKKGCVFLLMRGWIWVLSPERNFFMRVCVCVSSWKCKWRHERISITRHTGYGAFVCPNSTVRCRPSVNSFRRFNAE